jgi:uncharacterized protein
MSGAERLVIDTNVVLSGLLFAGSIPSRAVLKAQSGVVLLSDATRLELFDVVGRARFDRFVERAIRQRLAEEYAQACRTVQIHAAIHACRDPRDDKFIELAVHGRADAIISGDRDLLDLHPFREIEILTPAEYLGRD